MVEGEAGRSCDEGGEENGATQAPSVPPGHSQARSPATEERQNRGEPMGEQGTLPFRLPLVDSTVLILYI